MHEKHKVEYVALVAEYSKVRKHINEINRRMFELSTSCRKCGCLLGDECLDWDYIDGTMDEKYEFTTCPECGDVCNHDE